MANRQQGFGMTAELARKKAAKFDLDQANDAVRWIAAGLAHGGADASVVKEVGDSDEFHVMLKDGVTLCNLANCIQPGAVKKVNASKMAFKQMENIGKFLEWCGKYGCAPNDMFQTVDLYENQNIPSVITGLNALGRKCQTNKWDGPTLGVKESTENTREFTEEQLRAGEAVIGLQAGSNKGASQAGQNFGKTRAIID